MKLICQCLQRFLFRSLHEFQEVIKNNPKIFYNKASVMPKNKQHKEKSYNIQLSIENRLLEKVNFDIKLY